MQATGSSTAPRSGPPRRKRGYWIPALIAMVVLLAIGVAAGAGDLVHSPPRALSGTDVASEIALGIQVQMHEASPPAVRCPSSEPVRMGWRFSCTLGGEGSSRTIDVVEVDRQGNLRWDIAAQQGR